MDMETELKNSDVMLNNVETKFGNSKAWARFKQIIPDKDLLKYKQPELALSHINFSHCIPKSIVYEIDGIALTLYYEKGTLTHVVTQGANDEGLDLFANSWDFNYIPQEQITTNESIIVKGVLTMSKENFEKVKNDYKTCRYATAGIARRLDGLNANLLDFIAYKEYTLIDNNYINTTDFNTLINKGFNPSPNLLPTFKDEESAKENVKTILESINTDTEKIKDFPYTVTGLIISSDDYEFVLKLSDTFVTTKLINYEWSLSSTNKMIPLANFKPVELKGTTVTKATLTSAKNYIDLNAPEGSIIKVCKADGIIPYIDSVVEKTNKTLKLPTECPLCKETLVWSGKHLMCNNPQCKNRLISQCYQIVEVLKVPRFTEKLIADLIEKDIIEKAEDIFKLKPEDIMRVKYIDKNISNKQALGMLKTIECRRKEFKPRDFIYILNLPKISYFIIDKIEKCAKENKTTLLEVFEKCDVNILAKVLKENKITVILNYMQKHRDSYDSLKKVILGK